MLEADEEDFVDSECSCRVHNTSSPGKVCNGITEMVASTSDTCINSVPQLL